MFDRAVMAYNIRTDSAQKISGTNSNEDPSTLATADLQILRYNMEYAKKGFSYSALKTVWNEIPISIRELPNWCQFKKTTKNTFDELKAN